MKTSSAKAKGRILQQLVRDKILERHKEELTPDDVRSVGMGQQGVDILLSPRAQELFPFSVECKNVEKVNVWGAYQQAMKNATLTPLLIIKRNHTSPLVVMSFSDFLEKFYEKTTTKSADNGS